MSKNKNKKTVKRIYFSGDVEADGPIPGPYSMSSFGLCVAGYYHDDKFNAVDPSIHTFYKELQPISDSFIKEAAAVSGLDRNELIDNGETPVTAMAECFEWVKERSGDYQPIFVAWPLSYDWTWMYWYFMNFHKKSPFGFSGCLDIKTMYYQKAGHHIKSANKNSIPKHLKPSRKHTHNALDDAMEQAELFANIFNWKKEDE